ncbi:MAG: type III polyketide synthase [bacterium]
MESNHSVIEGVGTALPEHQLSQQDAFEVMHEWLENEEADLSPGRAEDVFDRAGVTSRRTVSTKEELLDRQDFGRRSDRYQVEGKQLGIKAIDDALERTGLEPGDIDLIITVSCTGFTIPPLDALIINELDFRPDVRRLPIAELGCAAGASALCRARDYLKAYPDQRVLILSVEMCSLTFQPTDRSGAQIVSAALFGDGAAAVVVGGSDVSSDNPDRPALVDYDTTFFEDTLDFMGYQNSEHGMHIMLSPRIPAHVKKHVRGLVGDFLDRHGLGRGDIDKWVLHPGGRAILDAFEDKFSLNGELDPSKQILRNVGNLSSATVLYVLRKVMASEPGPGSHGLLMAFGPGFSADIGLLKWGS